jgi:hypothetical protein
MFVDLSIEVFNIIILTRSRKAPIEYNSIYYKLLRVGKIIGEYVK